MDFLRILCIIILFNCNNIIYASSVEIVKELPIELINIIALAKSNGISFGMTITNQGGKSLEIYSPSLPWGTDRQMVIVLVPTRLQTPLKQVYKPVNPVLEITTIKPQGILTGEIRLSERFPELLREIEIGDVLLFWSYQTKTVKREATERKGGYLVIPCSRKEGNDG